MKGNRSTWSGGFTLVELLIVVVILGIMAGIAIPMFQRDADDSTLVQLQTDLHVLRNAIERYYHQHNATYPGIKKTDGSDKALSNASQAAEAFVDQLTKYTDAFGGVTDERDAAHPYGPYLKRGIPANPYNKSSEVVCDLDQDGLSAISAEGTAGWRFYTKTGVFRANDSDHKDY